MLFQAERRIWYHMLQRCENEGNRAHTNYGGRGIRVCERWRGAVDGFRNFLADLGPRPGPDYSLDRIDNEKGYQPGNVRWATRTVQARNTRRVKMVTYRGETKTLSQWAEQLGMDYKLLSRRLRQGLPPERAFAVPRRKRLVVTAFGETKPLYQFCDERGMDVNTVRHRLEKGWAPEEALTGKAFAHHPQYKVVEWRGRQRYLHELAAEHGMPAKTVAERVRCGWNLDEALTVPKRSVRHTR